MSRDWWEDVLITLEDIMRDTENVELNQAQRDVIGAIMVLYEGINGCTKKYPDDFDCD